MEPEKRSYIFLNDDIDIKMKPEKRTYIFLNDDIDIKMKPENGHIYF